ncbi:MAG: phosphotriesterase [Deltaproteobacteria bacterium]|nr:phosphotriesterase [Deltaproteobacteria bacterium]
MALLNTVLGPCNAADLGVTLMHEHLLIGWPGWNSDTAAPAFNRKDTLRLCIERMQELKSLGLRTFVDPCPIDLGRDAEFAAEVAQATGVNIICATGLYKEDTGAAPYFKFRAQFGRDVVSEMTETFVSELTQGIGLTGIKAGIIKVATGAHKITAYEEMVLRAAARAHKATGAPITTHTDEGTMGPAQLDIFASEGADLRRIIIGHSCGSSDLKYHVSMLERGALLGFDRFGLDILQPDRVRTAALVGLLGIEFHNQIVLSHDTVWCWRGRGFQAPEGLLPNWNPAHIFKNIVPALREAGVPQAKIDALLIHNPRRYFAGA